MFPGIDMIARTTSGMSVRAEGCAFSPLAAIGSHA
jgi:hypothetical protein